MTHLITGYAGKEHIKSADQGSFNASFFGTGEFVMEIGSQMKATILNNNTIRIADGDLLMQGRHVRINPSTYEDMIIDTGTSNMNRIDLIVCTYEKNASSGVETATIEVVKGTPASGTPSAPSVTAGNIITGATKNQMVLYKVAINGVALASCTKMFATCPTYKKLAEQYAAQFQEAVDSYIGALNILDTMASVNANTQANQLAGALSLKEFAASIISGNQKVKAAQKADSATSANAVAWGNVSGKPSSFTPTSHNHDERYYTEAEMNSKLNGKANSSHTHTNYELPVGAYYYGLGTNAQHTCPMKYGTWTWEGAYEQSVYVPMGTCTISVNVWRRIA